MSTSIDERVVYMKFDNKNFENNAQDSLRTLDKLKSSLDFKDVQSKLNNVDLSGLKRSMGSMFDNVDTSKMVSAIDKLEYRMSTLGQFTGRIVQNVADDIYSVIKKALSGIDQVVDYASSGIIQGGYRRASNIQTAKFQLEGLGISWNEIKDDIDFAVTNTAYSLDQAALVAANLTTAGLRPGKEWVDLSGNLRDEDLLAMVLRSISGTAASTGGRSDYSDIGRILTQMVSLGKVNQQQLNELSYRGIAANDVVAEYFSKIAYQGRTDWTAADIREITGSRDNTLSPYVVIEALYEKFGEHAVKANETLSGVMANTKSALARIGENFFEPIIENNGPLVHAFEVLRQSINGLNTAIKPVVNAFGKDIAGVINKFTGNFLERKTILDENGNPLLDEEGNEQYTYQLKKKGGLFSDFVEDLYVGEWKEKGIPGQSDHTYVDFDGEVTTRAAIIAENLRVSAMNFMETISLISTAVSDAIHAVFPNADSLAETLVKITTKIREITDAWKNLPFLKDGAYKKSGLFRILRGLAAGVDIIFRFGSSFKKHIIDPIFNTGKKAAEKSGLGEFFLKFFDSIYEFDQKIKNFDGDFFGPFFERVKTIVLNAYNFISEKLGPLKTKIVNFFNDIKPGIKSAFDSIVEWWKPVKDILLDSDLSIKEKWEAIKKYFADNFEIPGMDKLRSLRDFFTENFDMPGWEKIKSFFSTIGDTVHDAWTKVKKVFGFGGDEEEPTLSRGGAGFSGNNGIYGTASSLEKNFSISEAINNLNTSTEQMSTIADRIKNFFTSISDTIHETDFSGINAAIIGFGVAIAIAIGAIAYVIYRAYKTLIYVMFEMPTILGDMLTSIDDLIRETAKSLQAQRMQTYANALFTISKSVLLLVGAFLAVAAAIMLVEYFDTDGTYMKRLKDAALFIGGTLALLGVIAVALVGFSGGLKENIGLNLKDGLSIARTMSSLSAVSAVIAAIVGAITSIAVLVAALGIMDMIDENLFDRGVDHLWTIVGILGIMVGVVAVINWLFGRIEEESTKNFVGATKTITKNTSLFGIASVITAITHGLAIVAGAIFVLGSIDEDVFETGFDRLEKIGWTLIAGAGIMYAILSLINLMPKTETLMAGKIIALFAGMAVLIGAVTTSLFVLTLSMQMLARSLDKHGITPGEMTELMVILGLFMVLIPGLILLAGSFAFKTMNTGNIIGLSAFMIAMSAATSIISKAVERLAALDPGQMMLAFLGLGVLLLGSEAIVIPLSKISVGSSTIKIALGIGLMLASLYPAALAIETLADLGWVQWISGLGMVILTLAAVGGITLGLEWLGKRWDLKDSAKTALNVLLLTLSLIPLGAGIALMMKAFEFAQDLSYAEKMGVMLATLVAYGALIAGTMIIINGLQSDNPPKVRSVLATLATVWTVSLALIPVAAAISMMFLALGHSNLDALAVGGVMLGFGAMIALLAAAIHLLTTSIGKIHLTVGQIGAVMSVLIGALFALATIAVVLGITVNQIVSVNASIADVAVSALALVGLSVVLVIVVKEIIRVAKTTRWDSNTMKGLLAMLGGISIVVAGLLVLSEVLITLNTLDQVSLLASAGILVAMGTVIGLGVAGLILLAKKVMSRWSDNLAKKILVMFGGFIILCEGLVILSYALMKVATIDSDKIFQAGACLTVMGLVITAMSAIIILVAKYGGDWKSGLTSMGVMISAAASLYIAAQALKEVGTIDENKMYKAGACLSVMGLVITGMSAIVTLVSGVNWVGALTGMGSVLACAGSLYLVAMAMKKIENMDFERLAMQMLLFGGGITLMAVIISLVGTLTGGIGTATIAVFAAMTLSLALAMLAAGAFLYLASDAIEKGVTAIALLIDTIIGLKDKKSEFSEGMITFFEGLVDGIVAGLAKLNEKFPVITYYLSSILGQLKLFVLARVTSFLDFVHEFLRISLAGISDIVNDEDIQKSLTDIIDGILDYTLDHAAEWTEKLIKIGQQIGVGIIDGILSPDVMEIWEHIVSGGFSKAAELLVDLKNLLGIKDGKSGGGGGRIPAPDGTTYSPGDDGSTWFEQQRKDQAKYLPNRLSSPDFEDHNVATAKRNAANNQGKTAIESLVEDIQNGQTGKDIEHAAEVYVDKFNTSMSTAWDTLTSGSDNVFVSAVDTSIIEFNNQVESGDLGKTIADAAGSTHTVFDATYSGKVGIGGTLAPMYGAAGNPVWNNSILSATAFLYTSVKKGEINNKLTSAVNNLHSTFSGMLNNSSSSEVTANVDPLTSLMLNPFTRKIWQLLNETLSSINGGTITEKIHDIGSTLFDKFNSSISPNVMQVEMQDVGEAITAGIYVGMVSPNSLYKIKRAGIAVSDACIEALKSKQAFSIHSPSERVYEEITKMIYGAITQLKPADISNLNLAGQNVGDIFVSGSETAIKNADDPSEMYFQARTSKNNAAAAAGSSDGDSYITSLGNAIDLSGIGNTLRNNWSANVGSLEDLLPDFSWDKGIGGNIDAAKDAWGNIKSIFTDDSGNFDLSWLFEGVGDQLNSGIDGLMSQFGLDGENGFDLQGLLGIDENSMSNMGIEDLGLSIDISGKTYGEDLENGFGGWDANDWMSNNTIDIDTNIDLDQKVLDDFLNQNTTLGLANSVPVAGGYRQSTIGSTYVNNYSYNQTNNSPTALNTREINRQNELLLNRRRRG